LTMSTHPPVSAYIHCIAVPNLEPACALRRPIAKELR